MHQQLGEIEIAIIMFQYHKKLLPSAEQNLFHMKSGHVRTRSNSQIISTLHHFSVRQQSAKFIGSKI